MAKRNEADYYEYFCKSAKYAHRAAKYLDGLLRNYKKEELYNQTQEMRQLEHEADAVRHEMIAVLAKEFLPPIEREDIVALAQELDNVVDMVDEVVQFLYMYDVDEIRLDALVFSELIIRCTDALHEAVSEFRNFRKSRSLKDLLIMVNTLESEGDALYAKSIRALFQERADAMTILTWTKLFDAFEDCLDACEDTVDIIESVIMKNS
ncbi:MAG: DUF47 family protein [Oscillospiraceae bacterium]|jgi:predicted phosphate transport protein (TIGR00153 family)|nr:DUF47 family protein [Oscillospiraceae bacterium]